VSALTLEQRKAIAAKAVATRRAKWPSESSPSPQALPQWNPAARFKALSELPALSLVTYYDNGWHHAKLIEAGPSISRLQSIPAYKGRPVTFEFPTGNIYPATA
jgi:hypothetical protein